MCFYNIELLEAGEQFIANGLTRIYHQNSGCKPQLQRVQGLRLVCAAQTYRGYVCAALLIFVLSLLLTTLAAFVHYFGDTSGLSAFDTITTRCLFDANARSLSS